MPADPVLIAETQAWFRRAAHDLRAASHNLTASPPLLDDVVFKCRVAAKLQEVIELTAPMALARKQCSICV